jgi:NADH-quinone oxidoreductase subunit L
MIAAATMAMVSRDIKRVWAYSTISQLGYMIMGLAAGGYVAGVFHLTTHAAFKALLFLCSGVFIHHFETNDMFDIGRRGGRRLKIPMVCMILAGAALASIPPTSGFFSKEAIMGVLAGSGHPLWSAAAFAGVFLTAYYTFRLIFVILFPRKDSEPPPDTAKTHAERLDYWLMAMPLTILAAAAVLLGFFMDPLQDFLGRAGGPEAVGVGHHWDILVISLCLEAAALALAWYEYGRRAAAGRGFIERLPVLREFFDQRWYIDHFYRYALDTIIYRGIAALCARNDRKVVDGAVDGFSRGTVDAGGWLSGLHGAMLQYKLLVIFAVMTLVGLSVIF